ncbi:MAG: MATE family efflux transporter [Desulfuromonadales bacterium]|nr:MATE family efflux transporter [Desulfuromonadales bacterium]
MKHSFKKFYYYIAGDPSKPVSLRRNVVNLSVPVLLSSLFQRLVSIVDIFLVGGVSAAAIAAVGLGQLMIFVAMTVFWGLATGATVVIAHLWGAGKAEEARKAAFVAILTCAAMTLIVSLVGVTFGDKLGRIMGARADVMAYASGYIKLVFTYLVFTTGLNILSAIMQGRGNTRTPMNAILLVNILHVIIAIPLIYGKLGFSPMYVKGAGYAINISEAIGFSYLLFYAIRHHYINFGIPDTGLWKKVWIVGYPVALERVAQQSGQILFAKFVLGYGTVAYAAHQVGVSLESLSFVQGAGVGIASTALMGQALGAKKYNRARIGNKEALRIAVVVMGLMACIFLFFPGPLSSLFTSDQDVIAKASVFLRLVALAQIPLAMAFVYAGSLRGTGDTFYVFLCTLGSMWGVRIFLAWIAAGLLHLSLYAVWGAFVVDWYVRAGAFAWRYHKRELHGITL